VKQVEGLEGPRAQKRRLRVILETLTGERSVAEACAELEVSEARFHVLRRQALQGALEALEPGQAGRPRKAEPEEPGRIEELERELKETKIDLQAALVRTELAVAMPHLVKKSLAGKKGGRAARRRLARKREKGR
jgi:hypothetical protein